MKNFKIKDAQYNVSEIRKTHYRQLGQNAVTRLKKKGFQAAYFDDLMSAKRHLLSLIADGSTVGVGDSHTIYAMDLDDDLSAKKCRAIPNIAALNLHGYHSDSYGYIKADTREEARQLLAEYLTSNVFILGANAITMQGEIINVDGVGNRVAGMCYGADRIIVVAGVNKIVPDEESGRKRVHFHAAPMDNIKYGDECASTATGICPGCNRDERICNITTIVHRKPIESDFHVILIGEELGF